MHLVTMHSLEVRRNKPNPIAHKHIASLFQNLSLSKMALYIILQNMTNRINNSSSSDMHWPYYPANVHSSVIGLGTVNCEESLIDI